MDYEFRIWKKGEKFVGEIQELSLLCVDSELNGVVRQLEDEKNKLLDEYAALDVLPPGCQSDLKPGGRSLGVFAAKASIIAGTTALVLIISIYYTTSRIEIVAGGVPGTFHFLSVLASKFETLPDKTRDKAMDDLDVIVESLQPFLDKVRPLMDSSSINGPKE